ncbi:BQ5605_C013g07374 [Microbotryum silenes-dioicae]|uniref:BQ5605_C013g07374 protein n=1 Tax=Microbotryum silenes-dioicae TaxID=796604 RepID=A0A2X0MCZ9_9BASI|nr:BQ5605_C013g07374 [Microbotryum silenes-dioicae]
MASTSGSLPPLVILGYQLREQIASGSTSRVYRARHQSPNHAHPFAAVKVVRLDDRVHDSIMQRKQLVREMRIHETLKHGNVLELFGGVSRMQDSDEQNGWPKGLYLCLALADGGDLFDKIPPDFGVPEDIAHLYFTQLVEALKYLGRQGICHRDVKPENCLLDAHGNLKLSDFGLATVFKYKGQTRLLKDRCGSPPYAAPELALVDPYAGEPIDVWSAGILLFTLLVGSESLFSFFISFRCPDPSSALLMRFWDLDTPWDEPTRKSPEFVEFVAGRFRSQEPWRRIGAAPMDFLLRLLNVDPSRRLGLDQFGLHEWYRRENDLLGPDRTTVVRPAELAKRLTDALHRTGWLGAPSQAYVTATQASQRGQQAMSMTFQGSIQLYSQLSMAPTQRSNPHLTRFFSTLPLETLVQYVDQAFSALAQHSIQQSSSSSSPSSSALHASAGLKHEIISMIAPTSTTTGNAPRPKPMARFKFGMKDRRGEKLTGSLSVTESVLPDLNDDPSSNAGGMDVDDEDAKIGAEDRGTKGWDVVMWKKSGDPMELKRVWKLLCSFLPDGTVFAT